MSENQHGIYRKIIDGWIQELINNRGNYLLKQPQSLYYYQILTKNIMY